jgi:nicotinamidase-related amidase
MDRLLSESSLLLVVDVQERLLSAMPEPSRARLLANAHVLLEAARLLGVATMASEQYPKGLGPTAAPIGDKLREMSVTPRAKVCFDVCGDLGLAREISAAAPRAVVLFGMETHICVFQTARELVRRGYDVFVVADAVASRTEENRAMGLELAARAGAFVAPTETVVFDWLREAGSDAFKTISKLVR